MFFDAKEEQSLVASSSVSCLNKKKDTKAHATNTPLLQKQPTFKRETQLTSYQPLIQNASTEQVQHVLANSLITLWKLD